MESIVSVSHTDNARGVTRMTDFGSDLGEVANCLKIQPISMKFGHSTHNLGNYLHKLKKVNFPSWTPPWTARTTSP